MSQSPGSRYTNIPHAGIRAAVEGRPLVTLSRSAQGDIVLTIHSPRPPRKAVVIRDDGPSAPAAPASSASSSSSSSSSEVIVIEDDPPAPAPVSIPKEPLKVIPFPRNNIPKGTEVRQSQIPGAGLGLWATMAFPQGSIIGVYEGTPVPPEEVAKRQGTARYMVVHSATGVGFDAEFGYAFNNTRWANDARYNADNPGRPHVVNGKRLVNNAAFAERDTADGPANDVVIEAEVDIKAGEEIFVSYGDSYWPPETALWDPIPVRRDEVTTPTNRCETCQKAIRRGDRDPDNPGRHQGCGPPRHCRHCGKVVATGRESASHPGFHRNCPPIPK